MNTETKPVQTFKEKVIKDGLTHQGQPVAIGDEISITEPQREFLRKKGFIAAADAKTVKGA